MEINSGAIQLADGTSRCAWNDGADDKYVPSSYVMLGIIKLGAKEQSTGVLWGQKHVDVIKKVKVNTLLFKKHVLFV